MLLKSSRVAALIVMLDLHDNVRLFQSACVYLVLETAYGIQSDDAFASIQGQ